MDDSIKLQRNQALDEYIALHYIPPASSFLFEDAEECRRIEQTPRKHPKKLAHGRKSFAGEFLGDIVDSFSKRSSTPSPSVPPPADIDEILKEFKDIETFTDSMLRIIREKDLIEADIYNGVFMDRKLFSKIRNDRNYQPSKRTALLLSVALHLTVEETQTFLGKAGYSLTHTSKMDIVIEFFLLQGNYNVLDINEALYDRGLPLLNPNV
jgi:hypothetical protein